MSETPESQAARTTLPLVALFAVVSFLNSALLFAVEPMFTKMVLPLLGGAPSVWNTCLLFFQSALLAGYLYAHATSRWMMPRAQALLHLVLLAASVSLLPLAVPPGALPPAESSTANVVALLRLLTITLGLPFLLLSAGTPMVQRWFASTGHPRAANPYFLYAASNFGSFGALIAYPTLIEPHLSLSEQSGTWRWLYVGLIGLLGVSALAAARWRARTPSTGTPSLGTPSLGDAAPAAPAAAAAAPGSPTLVPTRAWRLRWVLLSFAPSSLLLGVTTFLSTDIAAVPFLWVAPLALYLLTFVLVFARHPPLSRRFMLLLQLFLGLGLMIVISASPTKRLTAVALLHLVTFFVVAMVCHRELADARPRATYLTEFYLWISLGGMLGGVFNVLLAPVLYDRVLEYPFALIIALGLRPTWPARAASPRRELLLDLLLPLGVFAMITAGFYLPTPPGRVGEYAVWVYLGAAALISASFYRRPLRVALAAGALFLGTDFLTHTSSDALLQTRSFFGVYRVRSYYEYTILQHGTTTHGAQSVRLDRRTDPLTYYHREGPMGDIFRLVTDSVAPRSVAIVGLGAGTTACYSRPDERWTYYEIDPLMVTIARSPALFSYLKDCQPDVTIIVGDARRSIASAPDSSFDLIVLDAFSSDAIPVHLLTREALQLYLQKLRPRGTIAFHVSNRYLDLRPALVELARDARLAGATIDRGVTDAQLERLYYGSRWVVLARSAGVVAPLIRQADWDVLAPAAHVRLWTDDYSDVWSVMQWRR
ncbi:MAG: fused MFS/spermidine synthase [Gemmatimonadaceae bacterium]